MTLRKHLLGTHITNIYTIGLERIIFIDLEGYNKTKDSSKKTLIAELMGRHSNIILVNSDNIIIDALRHFSINSGSYRNIYAGEKYMLPDLNKLDFFEVLDEAEFSKIITNNSIKLSSLSISNIVANTFAGISKSTVNSIENILQVEDTISKENITAVYNCLHILTHNSINNVCKRLDETNIPKPINANSANIPKSTAFDLKKEDYYIYNDSNKSEPLQINWFLDDYYTSKEIDTTFTNYRNSLLKLILNKLHKLNSKLDLINEKIAECKDTDKYRLYGELITSNLYKLDNHNVDSITLENYYDNNNLVTIQLDKSISPSANAKKFFKKYQKLKNAKLIVDEQKKHLLVEINYLESIVYEIESADSISDIDEIYAEIQEGNIALKHSKNSKNANLKKKNKETFKGNIGEPLRFEIDGFTVFVGKNNKQNDYLTTKFANDNDMWLHVKDLQGSHVIIKTEGKMPSQDTINKCAMLAKAHSKANQSSNATVDYTLVKYVKKPSGSKPGMVIYTHEKSVTVK